MANWEYTTLLVHEVRNGHNTSLEPISEAELMNLGAQGWELVAVVDLSIYPKYFQYGESTRRLQYIFKRPIL